MKLFHGHLKTGFSAVRSAKIRSFWTMLGVIIGVASIISVVAIGEGIKQQISGQIHRADKNLITIRPAQLHGSGSDAQSLSLLAGLNTAGPLSAKDIATTEHVKGLAATAPLTIASGAVAGATGNYRAGSVIGTTPALPGLLNQSLAYGSFWGDDESEAHVAVLGQHAVESMFNEDVPLGGSFSFHGEQFIVRGIFNQFPASPLTQQLDFNNVIFIPNQVAEQLSNNTAPTYQILTRPADASQTDAVTVRIKRALDKTHGGQSGVSVLSGNQNLAASNTILDLLTRLIAGVAAISLLVSGIGIMNVMLVSVAERVHEIGIRKAVGATNRQIWSQFMLESTVLGLSGGAIGIALACAIDIVLRIFTDLQPVIQWQVVLLASGTSLLVGVIFGTVPAFKAARKDPIEALRGE